MDTSRPAGHCEFPFSALRVTTLSLDYAKGFMLPLLVYQQSGGSTLAVGIAYFVEFMPRALLSPVFGSIIDRSVGKRIVFGVEGLRLLLMLVWTLLGKTQFGWMLSSVVSLLSGMSLVYYEATAAQRLSPASLQRFQTRSQLLEPLARLVGPGVATLAFSHLSPRAAIGVLALGYGLLLAESIAWRPATTRVIATVTGRWTPASECQRFAALARNTKLLALTFAAGLLNVFFGVFQSLIAPTMIGLYGLPVAYSAMPSFVGGAISFVLCIVIPRVSKNLSHADFGTLGTLCLVAAAVMSALDLGPWPFSLAFGLLIVGSALYGIFFRHMRYELIPEHQHAQGIGATTSVTTAFLPVAGLVTAATTGYPSVLVIGSVGIVVAVALYASIRFAGDARAAGDPIAPADS
jgi:MFS family permease